MMSGKPSFSIFYSTFAPMFWQLSAHKETSSKTQNLR